MNMQDNDAIETKNNSIIWLSNAIVAIITVVVLVVLLSLQPWSGSPITEVNSFRLSTSASYEEGDMAAETLQEMAYISPARTHIVINPEGENQEIIIIGGNLYANDERYVTDTSVGMSILMSVAAIIPSEEHTKMTMSQLVEVEELAIERVSGVTCWHYRGSMDLIGNIEEQIASLDPEQENYEIILESLKAQIEMMQEITTIIDVWVGRDDGFVRQIRYEAQVPSNYSESPAVSIQSMKYYDINKSIIIEEPLDSNGELLPGWYRSTF